MMHLALMHICMWLCSWCTYLLLCSQSIPLLRLSRIWIWKRVKKNNFKDGYFYKWILLTNDAIKDLPVRGIENPVWLTGGEDERSCKPIMVEHLQWVGLKTRKKQFYAKFKQSCLTSPSGQTKVKLNPTGGAGCKSVRRNLFQTFEHNCSGDNLCFQTRCNRSQRLLSL